MTCNKAVSPVSCWFKSLSGKWRASRHYEDGNFRGLAKYGRSGEVTMRGLSIYTFPLNLMASKSADAQELLTIYVFHICGQGHSNARITLLVLIINTNQKINVSFVLGLFDHKKTPITVS